MKLRWILLIYLRAGLINPLLSPHPHNMILLGHPFLLCFWFWITNFFFPFLSVFFIWFRAIQYYPVRSVDPVWHDQIMACRAMLELGPPTAQGSSSCWFWPWWWREALLKWTLLTLSALLTCSSPHESIPVRMHAPPNATNSLPHHRRRSRSEEEQTTYNNRAKAFISMLQWDWVHLLLLAHMAAPEKLQMWLQRGVVQHYSYTPAFPFVYPGESAPARMASKLE